MNKDRLVCIAARVAGTVQLQGPFSPSTPQNTVSIDIPFGLSGGIVPLLLQSWGDDPKNLNAVQQLEKGPVPDVEVGYSIVKSDYRPNPVPQSWDNPSDDSFDFEIEVTHINGYALSNADRATLDKVGLTQLVRDKVYDKHAGEAPETD